MYRKNKNSIFKVYINNKKETLGDNVKWGFNKGKLKWIYKKKEKKEKKKT